MEKPTKTELKEQRKMEWQRKVAKDARDAKIKKFGMWGGIALISVLFIAGLVWILQSPSTTSDSGVKITDVSSKDIATGSENPKVTVVEYSDFQCPACKTYHPIVNALIDKNKDKMKFVYRFFPLTQIHQNAQISAQAAYAANLQGKFWDMGNMLFDNQDDWATLSNDKAKTTFEDYAKKLGMDTTKFVKDMESDAAKNAVADSAAEGTNAGINSTPTFFINGKEITNPQGVDGFQKLIDDASKAK